MRKKKNHVTICTHLPETISGESCWPSIIFDNALFILKSVLNWTTNSWSVPEKS